MILQLQLLLLVALLVSGSDESERQKRSLQPGAPNVNNKDQPWQLDPHIERDGNGNTRTDVNIKHHGDRHDAEAGWSKVVRGPNKAKPTWHVGGTYRWRRTDVNIKHHGDRHDAEAGWSKVVRGPNKAKPTGRRGTTDGEGRFNPGHQHDAEAGWSKVVRGPNKAKPTWHVGGTYRWRRSLQPGAPNVNNKDQPWQLDPHIERDGNGNTRTDVNIKHHGDRHDAEAGWSKVVRGPNKAKPTWHVGGTYRWRRSLQPGAPNVNNKDQPWQLDPHIERDGNGNTRTDVNIKHHGDRHDAEAGWSKVVRGPNKAKPTWHVGGTYRWRRSLQPGAPNVNNKDQPWQLDPHIERDGNGNTRTDVNIKHHGDRHDAEAGWSKVVRGPNKAKPTWHVGGTYRWRRSLQPGAPNVNNKDQPWQLDPHIERDGNGNTRTDVNIKHHGDRHDAEAGWSKVVRGPNKAKPTWHREAHQPWQLDPHIERDGNGNTRTDVNIKHHGDRHDAEAGWSKVVRGPNKAKPTWHVGGTYRWRRALQPGAPNVNNKDQPWQLDPHIERDGNGNTRTDVNIKHHGDRHDAEAGWSKVVRGPNKAKPTWHVGGTYRWRRSIQSDASELIAGIEDAIEPLESNYNTESDEEESAIRLKISTEEDDEDKPWRFNPNLDRGEDGNTKANINIERHGENHGIEAGWSKVIDGPNKAKPTWHVGGSFKW
ncbi:hypothetical protein NQ315_004830 [Exocentrus adspersus]|uniref:Uncharacterized protein n=1 Tax=Exocentrus adspersus TaxID=1586481 RepID=A0AAV8W3J2_9CUCU|nr:hypothetical protein NQ315_004830 [Exocentrus adspersus]